jgi:ABC-type bacteriocin/lantibiotic exporter with double-glycine peptidase domain
MNKVDIKAIRKSFVRQHDHSDCGIACLMSIINYFGGRENPEKLRELSGTDSRGTTLLGLCNASVQSGFVSRGMQAEPGFLDSISDPVILHVTTQNNQQHFVVCYGRSNDKYIIGDPASGIEVYTYERIKEIWKSKALLKLYPGKDFVRKEYSRSLKIKWIKELIKKDIGILSASLFLGIAISILGIAIAVFSQKLIDDILPNSKKEDLVTGLAIIVFFLFVRGGLAYLQRFFGIVQGRDFNMRIIDLFFSGLLKLPRSFFDNRLTGDLVARLNDTRTIQQTIAYIAGSLILNVLVLIVSGTAIFIYSATSGIIICCAFPVYFIIACIFHNSVVSAQRAAMEAHSKNESNYINTIQGIDIIKSTGKEDFFSGINKAVYGFYQHTIYKLGKINVNLGLVTDIMGAIFSVVLLSVNSFMVINKLVTIGEFTAIISISSSMLPAIASLAFSNIHMQGARIAFDRMFEFTGLRKENITEAADGIFLKDISRISFENISFRFPGRKQILKDISFTINKGEMITLYGESGCGKTTLINIIQRHYFPESGRYLVNNIDAGRIPICGLRTNIAVVPQELRFFKGSVIENICLSDLRKEGHDVLIFCKKYGFDRFFSRLPLGYGTMLGEDGPNISGGQKQLISFARALYRNPKMLLLDEPTSSMDIEAEEFVVGVLNRYKTNAMIILVTHRLRPAKESDRIYIINNGLIEQSGSHEYLKGRKNLYSLSYRTIVQ